MFDWITLSQKNNIEISNVLHVGLYDEKEHQRYTEKKVRVIWIDKEESKSGPKEIYRLSISPFEENKVQRIDTFLRSNALPLKYDLIQVLFSTEIKPILQSMSSVLPFTKLLLTKKTDLTAEKYLQSFDFDKKEKSDSGVFVNHHKPTDEEDEGQEEEFGFILLATKKEYVESNVSNIERFHPGKPVVVIDQHGLLNKEKFSQQFPHAELIEMKNYHLRELNVYLHYLKFQPVFAKKMIYLHDSMLLTEPLPINVSNEVEFLWHFTNHRVQWSEIKEPVTIYNRQNKIDTHDDLVLHVVDLMFRANYNHPFYVYFKDMYHKKSEWVGCFAFMTLMKHSFLKQLAKETKLFDAIESIIGNDDRKVIAFETIFSIACQYTMKQKIDHSLGGLYYDGVAYYNNFTSKYFTKRP